MDGYEQNREQDMLGSIYMKLNLGSHWTGQFFTPYGVCQNMSGISTAEAVKQIQKKGYVTMLDSASGAGAILIATANSIQRRLRPAVPILTCRTMCLRWHRIYQKTRR